VTPLEELRAAHERLSELWNQTGGNYWQVGRSDPGEGWFYVQNADTGEDELYTERGTNVDLTVTLHRTIDAQLAVLGHSFILAEWHERGQPSAGMRSELYDALELARAINAAS
jgi:hypothetical protein